MTKQSVIYVRVSTDEQADKGYSLPHQYSECRKYASLNDFSVLQEFLDDYSGATLERPGFSMLREFIAHNQVDAVIVYTADRLSRNIVDFLVLRDQWEKAGIELHYVDRGKSQNTFEGLLTDGIFALLAHGERLKIIERTTNGRHNKAKNNHIVMTGIPPYGYKRVGKGKEAQYVIDPYQAEVVKNIFDWYVNGYDQQGPLSLRGIARLLDQMGISPANYRVKKMAPFWHPNSVAVVLKNSIYTGVTYYGKLKTVDGKRIPRPKDEWIPINVPHLTLISNEIFEQAQKRALRNIELSKRNRKRDYLMSGHFRCATCGNRMSGILKRFTTGSPKSYYICSATFQKGRTCNASKKQISVHRVDTAMWEWVTAFLEDENNLDEGIRAMMEKRTREVGPMQERLETIENLLSQADIKIQHLVDELSEFEGYTVREVIREKIMSIEGERKMLSEEGERLLRELEQNDILPDVEDQIMRTAQVIREKLFGATFEDKRIVMDALDVKAEYLHDELHREILRISCIIPIADGQIALSPSPKSSRYRCRCLTANLPRIPL